MTQRDDFRDSVTRDNLRHERAQKHKAGLFGFIMYGGTLGLLLVVPMVGGAYLGRWLDSLSPGYETRWTVSLIILGIVFGVWNVIWFIRDHS
ncbi:MAG: AtpZ/AtpI family protein [Hahellaceae bacterium]|nr:AtpZ/AtpI family protein [Hahellaceae bacterium]